jgi:hypothetical protein
MLLRGTAAGRFYSEINCTDVQNSYIWHFDRTSTLYKPYLLSHSFGLLSRIIHSDNQTGQTIATPNLGVDNRKLCKCCMSATEEEDEVHFMINCAAYGVVRMKIWHNLNVSLTKAGFYLEWHSLKRAPAKLQTFYLLGRNERAWRSAAIDFVDKHVRPFILEAVEKRNECMLGHSDLHFSSLFF